MKQGNKSELKLYLNLHHQDEYNIEQRTFELYEKIDRTKNDEILISAFQAGRDKILKHYKKRNWIYCISLILDPRHKIAAFDNSSWGKEMKDESIKVFKEIY